jgi:hypothetical protein
MGSTHTGRRNTKRLALPTETFGGGFPNAPATQDDRLAAPRSLPALALLSELVLCRFQFRIEVLKPGALAMSSRADQR